MPVLPLVGSTRVAPGARAPRRSASSTRATPTRSLTLPQGLRDSIFTSTRAPPVSRRLNSTIGVRPTDRTMSGKIMIPAVTRLPNGIEGEGCDPDALPLSEEGIVPEACRFASKDPAAWVTGRYDLAAHWRRQVGQPIPLLATSVSESSGWRSRWTRRTDRRCGWDPRDAGGGERGHPRVGHRHRRWGGGGGRGARPPAPPRV